MVLNPHTLYNISEDKYIYHHIQGLQMTTVVERMFHVETAAERAAWLEAIQVPATLVMVMVMVMVLGSSDFL